MDACGVSLLAWFFRDIGVSSVTSAAEERLFCCANLRSTLKHTSMEEDQNVEKNKT